MLGVSLGIEEKEGRDRQYEGIMNNIKKTLGAWKQRRLKLKWKVVVVNALIMSKLVYVMNVMDGPERVLKEVERMVSDFLWDGKGVRIAKEVLENEYEDRGLKLVNLERKKKHVWKVFLTEAINKTGGCGESGVYMEMKKGMINGVTDYYKEMLGALGEFVRCVKYCHSSLCLQCPSSSLLPFSSGAAHLGDDPAHQAHLLQSTPGYICPGCAANHRQFVLVTTLVDIRSRSPCLLCPV